MEANIRRPMDLVNGPSILSIQKKLQVISALTHTLLGCPAGTGCKWIILTPI